MASSARRSWAAAWRQQERLAFDMGAKPDGCSCSTAEYIPMQLQWLSQGAGYWDILLGMQYNQLTMC